jgi:hypothetical protein
MRPSRGRRGRPGRLAGLTTAQLQDEINRRQSAVPVLMRQRDELTHALSAIELELKALGAPGGATMLAPRRGPGRPPGSGVGRRGGRRRARNAMSLVDALRKVLNGRTLSVTDAVGEVQKIGYRSNSKTFRTIVNQALLANPSAFKKEGRGLYTAK